MERAAGSLAVNPRLSIPAGLALFILMRLAIKLGSPSSPGTFLRTPHERHFCELQTEHCVWWQIPQPIIFRVVPLALQSFHLPSIDVGSIPNVSANEPSPSSDVGQPERNQGQNWKPALQNTASLMRGACSQASFGLGLTASCHSARGSFLKPGDSNTSVRSPSLIAMNAAMPGCVLTNASPRSTPSTLTAVA